MLKKEFSSDWKIKIREVSSGVYTLTSANRYGNTIELSGIDQALLVEEYKAAAQKIDKQLYEILLRQKPLS